MDVQNTLSFILPSSFFSPHSFFCTFCCCPSKKKRFKYFASCWHHSFDEWFNFVIFRIVTSTTPDNFSSWLFSPWTQLLQNKGPHSSLSDPTLDDHMSCEICLLGLMVIHRGVALPLQCQRFCQMAYQQQIVYSVLCTKKSINKSIINK